MKWSRGELLEVRIDVKNQSTDNEGFAFYVKQYEVTPDQGKDWSIIAESQESVLHAQMYNADLRAYTELWDIDFPAEVSVRVGWRDEDSHRAKTDTIYERDPNLAVGEEWFLAARKDIVSIGVEERPVKP